MEKRVRKSKSGPSRSPFDISSRVEGLRILIIDNDPAKLDALASMLRSMGALVAVGGRGKSGYAQASRVPPDVIISELISPGEQEWKLVEYVRRHPVLRWTPFLLLKWWEEGEDGHGIVLRDKLLERIEEVLTPLYVVQERMRTNRPLGGHFSSIGPVALLRLLVNAGLVGTLTVNDGWSVFEVKIKKNAMHSVRREGVAGYYNEGKEAFVQLLVSDSGRWSFRIDKGTLQPANIDSNLEKVLSESSTMLAALFKRGVLDGPSHVPLRAHLGIIDTADSALSVTAQRITEALENRAATPKLDALVKDINNPMELERALRMLVQVGVIVPFPPKKNTPTRRDEKAASECASYLFSLLKPVFTDSAKPAHPVSNREAPNEVRFEEVEHQYTGAEHEEEPDSLPPPSETVEPEVETMLIPELNTPSIQAERAKRAQGGGFQLKPRMEAISKTISQAVSTVISSIQELPRKGVVARPIRKVQTVTFQMWIAIVITVLFGSLIVAGLALIASDQPPDDRVENSENTTSLSSP